jgi:hypothetical protein
MRNLKFNDMLVSTRTFKFFENSEYDDKINKMK